MNKNIRAKMAYKYLVCAILLAGATACDKEGFEYNNEVETSGTQYLVTDTITMNVSTTYIDSIQTSGQGVALVGTNIDPYLGTITSSSFFKLKAYTGGTLEDNAIYDSIVLMVHPTLYAYGDTTGSQGFEVYKVTEKYEKNFGNTGAYYSNASFATDPTPLGSISIAHIRPHLDSVYSIKLDDNTGKEFFNQVYNKLPTITNQTQFSAWFPGLNIRPNANSSLISGIRADDSLTVRLYYHVNASTYEWKSIDFPMYESTSQFNHVDVTRPVGSPLELLTPNSDLATNKLSAESANNLTYVQPLTHLVTRIEFPYIKSFSQTAKFYKIMKAELSVKPVISSYAYPYELPSKLTLVSLNAANQVTDSLTTPSTGGVQGGNLFIDQVYNLNTAYTYDVTNYLINQINATETTKRSLGLITPGSSGITRFDRVLLGGPYHKSNPIQLKIYYLLYN